MPQLNIPERYRAGVAKIGNLDDTTVRLIRSALDGVIGSGEASDAPTIDDRPDNVATAALATIAPIAETDFKQIADTLNALYGVRSSRDVSIERFAEEVADAMESLDPPLRLEHSKRSLFVSKLTILLGADVFGIVSKAWDLRTDDERVFCHARIITDLRPVFGKEIEDGPQAMVVVHLLKIAFHKTSKKHEEFYVSLDGEDLTVLRSLIDRAEAKAKTLKSCIKDVKLFGVSSEE